MLRRPAALDEDTQLAAPGVAAAGATLDDRWNGAAARLLASLLEKRPVELDPELERFLRRFIRSKAVRYGRRLGERAHGVDADDVAQRVFLQLFEHPPDGAATGKPMRRLLSWVSTVSRNYLYDLTSRPAERLSSARGDVKEIDRAASSDDAPTESHYAAHEALLGIRPALEKDYPAGVPLLTLLLDSPHATSQELARQLGTSAQNVDQMRSRIRRVLRRHLGESRDPSRRSR